MRDYDAVVTKMDLWADDKDNDQAQQAPLGVTDGLRRTLRGSRRLSERDVLSQLRAWLLEEYMAPYCRALASTRIFRHCYWIDALDGVTRAQLTATPIEKSEAPPVTANERRRKKDASQTLHEYPPVLHPTIKLSQELALESRPITLHGLFLSSGSSSTRRRTESRATKDGHRDNGPSVQVPIPLPKESAIIPQNWLDAASQILPAIEQSPAIFLLNPLAPLLFTEGNLIPLYRRATPTELCLFLPHKQIIAHLQAARTTVPSSQGVAATLTTLLRTDRWKTLVPEGEETSHAHNEQHQRAIAGFIELFSASVKRHFAFPVQTIPMRVVTGPATIENAPYTLLFATKRQDSLFSMNNALCCYQRRLEEESYHGVLGEEWFRSQQQSRYDEARRQLTQRILSQGHTQRIRRWPDLRQQLLVTLFGQFLMQDYDRAIKQCLLSGEVSCAWRKAPSREEQDRVPGNDDTLVWR